METERDRERGGQRERGRERERERETNWRTRIIRREDEWTGRGEGNEEGDGRFSDQLLFFFNSH